MLSRAARKRAARLRKKLEPSLSRSNGSDLASLVERQRIESCLATLDRLEGEWGEPGRFALGLAQEIFGEMQALWDRDVPRFAPAHKLAEMECRAGCSWCCHQPLRVSALSAVAVAGFLIAQGRAEATGPRLEEYCRSLADLPRTKEALGTSFEPCPFLDESENCSVYPARPVLCRAFHSTDRESCQRVVETRSSEREVPMFPKLYGLLGVRLAGARRAFSEVGIDDRPVVLGPAVRLLLQDFPGTVEAWLQGKPVFEEVAT